MKNHTCKVQKGNLTCASISLEVSSSTTDMHTVNSALVTNITAVAELQTTLPQFLDRWSQLVSHPSDSSITENSLIITVTCLTTMRGKTIIFCECFFYLHALFFHCHSSDILKTFHGIRHKLTKTQKPWKHGFDKGLRNQPEQ